MIRIATEDEIYIGRQNAQKSKQEQKERRGHQDTQPKDKENRDPNNINDHIVVSFDKVLGEPSTGPRSIEFVWECSGILYNCMKTCIYKIATLFCGVCIAIPLACDLAVTAFYSIWICGPCIHVYNIYVGVCCKSFCVLIIGTCVAPFTRIFAYFFSRIRCTTTDRPPSADKTGDNEEQRKKRIRERQKLKENFSKKEEPAKKEVKTKEAPAATNKPGATVIPANTFSDGSDKVARSVGRSIKMFN